ncbi:hypothetical protein ABZ595_19170 [Streptomyces rubradiris]|uniref:hypothetical protein n=1 Tax=Streptomyces rubradiris TaxID=285531 RepID=UPI0034027954
MSSARLAPVSVLQFAEGLTERQALHEIRSPVPDEERMEELKAGRQAVLTDQAQLVATGPEETGRIAAVCAARLKELKES